MTSLVCCTSGVSFFFFLFFFLFLFLLVDFTFIMAKVGDEWVVWRLMVRFTA